VDERDEMRVKSEGKIWKKKTKINLSLQFLATPPAFICCDADF
jgi:hypothetical protein